MICGNLAPRLQLQCLLFRAATSSFGQQSFLELDRSRFYHRQTKYSAYILRLCRIACYLPYCLLSNHVTVISFRFCLPFDHARLYAATLPKLRRRAHDSSGMQRGVYLHILRFSLAGVYVPIDKTCFEDLVASAEKSIRRCRASLTYPSKPLVGRGPIAFCLFEVHEVSKVLIWNFIARTTCYRQTKTTGF